MAESLIWAAVLTAVLLRCCFRWALNLPMPLWPTIDIVRSSWPALTVSELRVTRP